MSSAVTKKTAGRPQKNRPDTYFGLKPAPDVYLLIAREINRRGFKMPCGGWAYGAVKMVLEDCIRNHLGPVVRKSAKAV